MTLNTAMRNALVGSVPATIDAQNPLGGYLNFKDASANVLVIINLPIPSLSNTGTGIVSKAGTWSGAVLAAAGAGTATTNFLFTDHTGNNLFTGTVGLGTGDISLDNNVLINGGTLTVDTFTVNQSAS